MRKMILSVAVVVLTGSPVFAQGSTVPKNSDSKPTIQAPVGHRQPRAADFPNEKNNLSSTNDVLEKENALLDRKIKSICRGC